MEAEMENNSHRETPKSYDEILKELEDAKKEIEFLKKKLSTQEWNLSSSTSEWPEMTRETLTNEEIKRYGRQLILPELGMKGQLALVNSSVLVVGAGGLGCPAAIYLAAAGIGLIGIVDYDEVELGNLHRQILHTQERIGTSKAYSIATSINSINRCVRCHPHHMQLSSCNAMQLIKQYDIVLDCTDNVATRYLLNDACVLLKKPLVSGSALRFEGQLTIYNHAGPCYRCLYPKPPPPETVTNCSEGGVLGVTPGIIGCLQALEALKIAAGREASFVQKLLLFDGLEGSFRTIKLRGKKVDCVVCGENPSVTELIDYEEFCGASATDRCQNLKIIPTEERLSARDFAKLLQNNQNRLVLDVRPPIEFDICRLPNSINIFLEDLERNVDKTEIREKVQKSLVSENDPLSVYVVCRRGNDSQKAVLLLRDKLKDQSVIVKDVIGGLTAWTHQVDRDFPEY